MKGMTAPKKGKQSRNWLHAILTQGIPESEEFHAGEKQLEEFFSSLTKRQIKLLCKIAAGFKHIEKVPLH
jgi:hypothetical protein